MLIALAAVLAAPAARAQPPAAGPIVSIDWLRQHGDDPAVVVISTDQPDAFARAHIPRAANVSHDDVLDHGDHRFPPAPDLARRFARAGASDAVRIVLYGSEPLALGWTYAALASIGHADHASVLDGNIRAWQAAGHPVATGAAKVVEGTLTPRPATDVLVDRAWVRGHLDDAATKLLDVRSPGEWKDGTIPGSAPVLWRELYADLETGRFKTPAAMRAVFERAGLRAGQTAVMYCAVGMRASLAYFAARAAGLPARVYLGSWTDWTRDALSPIAR
jgi:thiosulfate/3-mercaptopyruvate sulfurtransferase